MSEVKSQIKSGQLKSWRNRDHLWQNSMHRKIQLSFFQGYIYALIFQQCNAISEIIQSSFPNCSKLKFRRFGLKIISELHAWVFETCGMHALPVFWRGTMVARPYLYFVQTMLPFYCYYPQFSSNTYLFREKIPFTYQISAKCM